MKLADFPFDHILTKTEQLGERLADPDQGIVLVESGFDASSALANIAAAADDIRGSRFAKKGVSTKLEDGEVSFNQPATTNYKNSEQGFFKYVTNRFNQHVNIDELVELSEVGENLQETALAACGVKPDILSFRPNLYIHIFNRQRGGDQGHTDQVSALTVWFGATQTGLRIGDKESGIFVPDVPVGHALIWRGEEHWGEDMATKHTVVYRGTQARVSAFYL